MDNICDAFEKMDYESAKGKLIVALDYDTIEEAIKLVEVLGDSVVFYKVGWQLFMGSHFNMVEYLVASNKQVFLDLKMTDIPATIEKSLSNIPTNLLNNIKFLTLFGSDNVVLAARTAHPMSYTNFLKVPALSSDGGDISHKICESAKKSLFAGADGLIVSGTAIKDVRQNLGNHFYIVSPGIRPTGNDVNDHKRSLTPSEAIEYGADYLVVGRPITESDNPKEIASNIINEIHTTLSK